MTDVVTLSSTNESELLAYASAIEHYSQHPLASAIVRKAEETAARSVQADHFQSVTGKGAYAKIGGVTHWIGNLELFSSHPARNEDVLQTVEALQQQGKTVMLLGNDQEFLGLIAVADPIRESSFSTLRELKDMGMKQLVMLTGDNAVTANAINQQLQLDQVEAGLLPAEKLEKIRELQQQYGKVAMVGDGINDAPALASANVGIAMGGAGTDTALETADVALLADDLTKLPYTMRLSHRTLTIIKQNIGFAFALKVLALLLIIPGWLTLWMAVLADVGSTLLVVLNSMRLMRVKD